MSKTIVIPCIMGGGVSPVEFKVGRPAEGSGPIAFQSKWLSSSKNGMVPPHILKALEDLWKISIETNSSFEELCVMAFNEAEAIKRSRKQQN
jgi:hypothetical protein